MQCVILCIPHFLVYIYNIFYCYPESHYDIVAEFFTAKVTTSTSHFPTTLICFVYFLVDGMVNMVGNLHAHDS